MKHGRKTRGARVGAESDDATEGKESVNKVWILAIERR